MPKKRDVNRSQEMVLRVNELVEDIERKWGKGAIYTLGEKQASQASIPRFKTKLPDLDAIIGGGMPKGRVIEIFGPEGGGKTTLAYKLCATRKRSAFIDMEGTFDPDIAFINGCRDERMIIRQPDWGETAMDEAMKFADAGIPIVVIDSIPTMTPHIEFEGKKGTEGNEGIAMIARLFSRKLPVLATKCRHSGTTVILINQVRDQIGGIAFGTSFATPGGRMIKHCASLRIQIGRRMWLKSADEILGQLCKVKVVKSKVCAPYQEAEIPLIFERGFVSFDDHKLILREVRKEHVVARRSEGKGDNEGALMVDAMIDAEEEGRDG